MEAAQLHVIKLENSYRLLLVRNVLALKSPFFLFYPFFGFSVDCLTVIYFFSGILVPPSPLTSYMLSFRSTGHLFIESTKSSSVTISTCQDKIVQASVHWF